MNNKEIIKNTIENLIKNKKLILKKYSPGGIIFNEGDTCENLGYIYKGKVNISTLSINDKEEIISSISNGDFFGQFLIFNSINNKYLGDIIAQKNTEIALLNKNLLNELLMNDKSFLNAYLSFISEESYKVKQQVKMLSHKNNYDRVLYYLNNNNTNGIIDIKSITNLARIVNLPRENVSRIISRLVKENIIKKNGNVIALKKRAS